MFSFDFSLARGFVAHGPALTGQPQQFVNKITGTKHPDERSAAIDAHETIVRLRGSYADSPEYLKQRLDSEHPLINELRQIIAEGLRAQAMKPREDK
jgi:hypothetical protein